VARRNGVTFELRGEKQLRRKVQRFAEATSTRGLSQETLTRAAEPMRERMSQMAPRGRTGTLADSITVATQSTTTRIHDGGESHRAQVGVGPSREGFYGLFIEVGTRHHAADPFMRPAADATEATVRARYHSIMSRAAQRRA
jgi:HK97 gp10 family phage protein